MEDCYKDTGKPPIPVRWVKTNKGDKKDPKVRCRLVAKHLAAKYGGKDMEDLFAAMPPFEMVKVVLVRSVQRRDRVKRARKIMFIDVSNAHLYAPVDLGTTAYVDLPPECSTPGIGGKLQYWLYGVRHHTVRKKNIRGGRLQWASSLGRLPRAAFIRKQMTSHVLYMETTSQRLVTISNSTGMKLSSPSISRLRSGGDWAKDAPEIMNCASSTEL